LSYRTADSDDPPQNSIQTPSAAALREVFQLKYGHVLKDAWSPRMRWRFKYFSPEEHYEALVSQAVGPNTEWLDVGCGRLLFPSNERLARALADRCRRLVGVDPDATIQENPYVHEKVQALLGDYAPARRFDLITLRMVAEHVTQPEQTVARIAELLKPGGRVIVYTVFKWSPAAVLADVVPFGAHHTIKRILWQTEEKDTFPVANLMNTRATLRTLFENQGCRERLFLYLDDCRVFSRFRVTTALELSLWRALHAVGLHYPELCIAGVYEKVAP
jgi:2-polyprenyl-3-methyl-5-hydroxy-6-metoxy-1,4-benzoquinol methylase